LGMTIDKIVIGDRRVPCSGERLASMGADVTRTTGYQD